MKNKFFKNLFIIAFVITLFALINLTNGKSRNVTVVETIATEIVTVPQKLFTYTKKWLTKDKEYFSDIDDLKNKNEKLENENEELKNKLMDYEMLLSENNTLKGHLKMQTEYSDYSVVVAEVIADSTSNWEKTYIINKGSKDGIMPDMAVITSSGLVGYIETVSESTSKVVSIIDAGNSVSGRVVRTRDAVVCKGSSLLKDEKKIKIQNIPIGVEIVEGDKIETSGLGEIYPKGIAIGEVRTIKLKKNPAENEAIVETYVDFNRLETVAVIVK